jgi:ribosome-associated translation inhibitor RaiA
MPAGDFDGTALCSRDGSGGTMTIPCEVKTSFDRSAPLNAHIARRLGTALHGFAHCIERVEVRLSDTNGPRVGPADKVTLVAISLRPSGQVIAKAAASNLYASVSRAATRARSGVVRHVNKVAARGRRRPGKSPGTRVAPPVPGEGAR